MEINIIDKENCKKEFDAVLNYEELKPHFEKALIEYRKKAQIPGFRKGKCLLKWSENYTGMLWNTARWKK